MAHSDELIAMAIFTAQQIAKSIHEVAKNPGIEAYSSKEALTMIADELLGRYTPENFAAKVEARRSK